MDKFDRRNFRLLLAAFIEKEDITVRRIAKAIGCPDATLTRILVGRILPTDELMKQGGIMFELGFERYSRLSTSDQKTISEKIGAIGGGVLGFGTITTAIGGLGLPGFSAAGITSGLSVLGGIVGGGMVAGVSVAAAIPLAVGAVGYAVIKGVKYLVGEQQLNSTQISTRWEILPPDREGCA